MHCTHSAEVHVQDLLGSLCCCCFFSASHFTLSASLHLRINVDSGKLPGKPDEMFFFWKGGGVTCDALAFHTVALLLFTTKTGMSECQLDRSCRSSDDLFLRLVIVGSIYTHGDQCTVSFE